MAKHVSSKKIFTKIEDSRIQERKEVLYKPKLFINKDKFYKNLKKITKNFPNKLFDQGNRDLTKRVHEQQYGSSFQNNAGRAQTIGSGVSPLLKKFELSL
jgi:hypothetical protein